MWSSLEMSMSQDPATGWSDSSWAVICAICLPLGGALLRMWEGLSYHQARILKGLPDYRILLGRPGTACWSSALLRKPWSLFLLFPRGTWLVKENQG